LGFLYGPHLPHTTRFQMRALDGNAILGMHAHAYGMACHMTGEKTKGANAMHQACILALPASVILCYNAVMTVCSSIGQQATP